jgi:hypothetical protein
MALDKDFEFSDKQSVALSSTNSTVSTYVNYNAASPKDCFGVSKALEIGGSVFTVQVTTALVGAGGTLTCALTTKAGANTISSAGTTICSVLVPAAAAAGSRYRVIIPPGTERLAYLGVLYTAGATISSGNVNAYLGPPSEENDS